MKFSAFDRHCMQQAVNMAQQAELHGEVPIGAILTQNNQIITKGWNCPISSNDPTNHAEIVVMREAAQKINNYRLTDTTLYVTLEPCIMCVGAMAHARIKRCVFGAYDSRAGACSGEVDSIAKKLNHQVIFAGGLLAEECGQLLQNFFVGKR